jgi:acetoin utilization deacetylase AcuC-like enzyme
MGFCLLNNVAVAARHAQHAHGLQRIAIVDFDVHHGNGTQDAFYADPSVLFISTHQSGSYPNTGKIDEVGVSDGEGTTINIPLPGGAGHEAALATYDEIIAPALHRFQPELLLVSAGYDAHWRDPLAGLQYRSSTYTALTRRLKSSAEELCQGRIVFLLEGGYDLQALGESVASTFAGLLNRDPIDSLKDPGILQAEPLDKVKVALAEVQSIHGL